MTTTTVRPSWLAILVALGALLTGLAWAWASPVMASPDDDYHMSSIWCPAPLATSGCTVGTDAKGRTTVVVPRAIGAYPCFILEENTPATCEYRGPDMVATARVDQGAYPGGYYRVMHLFTNPDIDRSILTMRTVNVALAVGLLGAAAWVAAPATRRAMALALVGLVPVGIFIVASVNPSSWTIVGVATLVVAWHSVLTPEPGARRGVSAVLAVLGAGVAAAARADASLFVGAALLGVAVLHWRRWREVRRWWPVPVLALAAAVASLAAVAAQASRTAGVGFGKSNKYPNSLEAFWRNLPEIVVAPWGAFGGPAPTTTWGLGWFDVPMPAIVYVGASGVAAGVIVLGLARVDIGKGLALAGFGLLTVAYPLYLMVVSHDLIGHNYQPRYGLSALLCLLFVAVLLPGGQGALSLRGAQPWVLWGTLVLANSAALFATLHRYTQGVAGPLNLRLTPAWWWPVAPTPLWVWFAGTVGFAILAGSVVRLNRPARPRELRAAATTARGEDGVARDAGGATRAS